MILTDNVNTFTDTKAQETAIPIWNSNQVVTIGGAVKQQADSQRLQITVRMRLTKTELTSLSTILTNFSQALFYTPGRTLYDKTTTDQFEVTADPPGIEARAYNGSEVVYHVTLVLNEVL